MWFTKLIKQFFFWIDKIVYNFIPEIYDLLLEIARTSILTQADIADMADRIYKLLAIFMVFKVTLSLITYVVNPDDFSDKTKGVAKLGTNIIISLSLLILTPYIFNYAYQIQTIIIEDNSLATLIFGDDLGEDSFLNSAGDKMSYIAMQAFFSPNLSLGDLHECTTLYETVPSEDGETSVKKFNDTCYQNLKKLNGSNFSPTTLENYKAGVEKSNLGLMFRQDLVLATAKPEGATEEDFIMDYKFIFSTVVGVVIILLLITFCMDVAVRSLKLAFYQLIAPIPILSYIDPKSGKDGMFKKWYEACFKTFLSLFIRLLAIYFAIYIISKVADLQLVDIVDGSYKGGFLLWVFVIIGALMFAKQLPKILEGLGIKLDGDGKFTLNPLKKINEGALGGKQLTSSLGAVGALGASALMGTAGAFGNIKSRWGEAQGFKAKAGLIAGGLTSGLSRGVKAGVQGVKSAAKGEGIGKSFTNSYSSALKGEKKRLDRLADGVGITEVGVSKLQQTLGMRTAGEKAKIAAEAYKSSNEKFSAAKNNIIAVDNVAKELNEQLKFLEASGIDRTAFYKRDASGNIIPTSFDEKAYNEAIAKQSERKKQINDAIDARVKDIMTGSGNGVNGAYMGSVTNVVTKTVGGKTTYDFTFDGGEDMSKYNDTSTTYVKNLNEQMVKETEKANAIAHQVDSNFGGASADIGDPKKTAKSSQTASSALPTTDKAVKATNVDKYANNSKDK